MLGVQFLEEGVVQVQNFGNKVFVNFVGFLNFENEDDSIEGFFIEEEVYVFVEKEEIII